MHQLVKLAQQAIENYIKKGEIIEVPDSIDDTYRNSKAGVFVSLKIQGHLRGCIGTFMPVKESVVEETIKNAIAAATEDPRFSPVSREEIDKITYSVDVLSPPEKVQDIKQLDPQKYGIIVVSGHRKGLLLPALEGVDTVDEQLRITKMKAGIISDEEVEIYRFEVKRYH